MTEQAIGDTDRLEVSFRDFVADDVVSIIVVQNHRPRFANQAAARLFGYDSPEEITALGSAEPLYAPHENARVREYGERRRAGRSAPHRYEVACQRRDGSLFWCESHVYWTTWQGAPASAIVLIDITGRKRAELAYARSEKRFRDFAELGSDWLWELDADLRYTYVSPRYTGVTSRPAELLLGRTRRELSQRWPHANKAEWTRFLATLDAHRDFDDFVYTVPHEDGRLLTLSNTGRALFDERGEFLGYRGIGRDLTGQVAAERLRDEAISEAQRARQQLVDSIEGISDAFILYDDEDRLVLCNERYREFYPYLPPSEELSGLRFEDLARLGIENRVVDDPDLRADPEGWLRQRLDAHRNATGEPVVQHWNDGRVILIREWRTRDGGIVGIRSDITALQRAEQRLLDAIESLDEGFVLWDADECMALSPASPVLLR
ncbi:MAG: PAS domain S-box protein [Acetobacterales bacterium]